MDVPWMVKPVALCPWSGVLAPADTVGQFAATFRYMKVMPFGGLLLTARFTEGTGLTVYDMIHSNEGILSACLTEDTRWFHHGPNDILNYQRLKEVCSGLGGIAIGAHHAGLHAIAHLDHNGLACGQLRANGATNVIHGSICEMSNIAKLHAAGGPQPAVLAAGFPCQPYSRQGDRLGEQDPRSTVFGATLKTAWVLQAPAIIALRLHHAEPQLPRGHHELPGQNHHAGSASSMASPT